ncbi:MAG: hypothetical protein ACTHOF_06015, partial [Flavisolibacter sp.]
GKEAARSIESNSKADYRTGLEEELKELRESELWQAGKTVRSLRPENQEPVTPGASAGSSTEKRLEKLKFSSPLYRD